MKTCLCLLGLLGVATCAMALEKDVPDKARREIERRGYLVQKIDDQISDMAADALAEAFAIPADDSHKFTLTVLYGAYRNSQLDKLKQDLLTAKELEPWVRCKDRGKGSYDVASTEESHLHCRFDQHKSPYVPKQWTGIKILDYPTLLLQPPRNGKWGPPDTVINQKTGYDGDPTKLAEWIRGSIGRYALAYSQTPQFHAMRTAVAAADGHRQDRDAGRYVAPFPVQPQELPTGPNPPLPFPPDLVPIGPQPLTSDQIKKVVPEADPAFVLAQLDAKASSPAEVASAWAAKLLRDKLLELENRLEERKPERDVKERPILDWLVGSGVLALLLHMALSYFGVYAKNKPNARQE